MSKKGDTPAAAYFIMMLALFLTIYVVLLPTQEKQAMMGEPITPPGMYTNDGVPSLGGYGEGYGNIFSDSPGFLQPYAVALLQRDLASISLYSSEEKEYETLAANVHIESTLVSKDKAEFIFDIDDTTTLQDVKLLFFVVDAKGEMTITVNGIKVLSGEITSDLLPVTIPKSVIGQVNRVTFEVKAPGLFAFMSKNTYTLKDVVVIKTFLRENSYEIRQFVLTEQELYDLNRMSLIFRPNCLKVTETGRLGIRLNGKLVHDAEIVCDAGVAEIDFSPMDLIAGRNILEFAIDKGEYTLENVVVEGDYSSAEFYKGHFTLGPAEMDAVQQGANIVLRARFVNDGYRKQGTFYVNGFPVYFDSSSIEFTTDLNGIGYQGENVISIVPDTPLEVVALDIFLA